MSWSVIRWSLRSSVFLALLLFHCPLLRAQGTGIALKPPLGWNTWYGYLCKVTDSDVRAQADWMVQNGMKAVGYEYVNIDDCWQGQRDAQGVIHSNGNFPDMKALGDYIHGKGLKFGVYSSPGPKTCAGYEGSYGHEEEDARTYAAWGVDFLKYDWCSGGHVYQPSEMLGAYKKMGDALKHTGRPILYSLCQYGLERVWTWGASVGANMWRTTGDLDYNYDRFSLVGFEQNGLERFAGPGHWNDPDMLLVGLGKITDDESRTQVSLWSLLAAPLIASADLRKISSASLAILSNPEIIAVDQDPAGVQGHRIAQEGPLDIWMKPLADGSKAVGLFNRGEDAAPITVYFKDAGVGESATLRDLWTRKDLGIFKDSFTVEVPMHGVVMIRMK
ncbi:MAG: glycoside hydrolase family 27 protein [Terriglobia bacterium]|jgi:alpha-galactosidase